jgi:hypothetical protein
MSDPLKSVRGKVLAIFRELVGVRADQLDGSVFPEEASQAITSALAADCGEDKAAKIALNMVDWNSDAAFVVALCLFPEQFTAEEINAGIGLFLCHAPNHIREACRLTGTSVWEDFPYDDDQSVT